VGFFSLSVSFCFVFLPHSHFLLGIRT
jgi:hypothetical protein